MARSGMYDQLAGGFARYAVDAGWVVPHFEKMLYDNALLLRAYTTWWKVTRDPLAERIVRETADFVVRDLGTETRRFRVVARRRRRRRRGPDVRVDTRRSCARSSATTPAPSLRSCSASRRRGRSSTAPRRCSSPSTRSDRAWFDGVRSRLLAARAERPQPGSGRQGRDVVERPRDRRAGRGRAPRSAARTGSRRPAPVRRATSSTSTVVDGELRRASRLGVVGTARAVADDHGNLAEGLLVLHQVTGELRWLDAAREVLDAARDFAADDGGFHDTSEDAEPLYLRPRSAADNAEPAGQSALAAALVTLGRRDRRRARPRRGRPRHGRRPRARGPRAPLRRLVARGRRGARRRAAPGRRRRVRRPTPTRSSRSPAGPRARGSSSCAANRTRPGMPLLADRPLVGGDAAAYVCRGMVCELPDDRPRQHWRTSCGRPSRRPPTDVPTQHVRWANRPTTASDGSNPRILQESPHDGLSTHRGRRRGRRRHP